MTGPSTLHLYLVISDNTSQVAVGHRPGVFQLREINQMGTRGDVSVFQVGAQRGPMDQ